MRITYQRNDNCHEKMMLVDLARITYQRRWQVSLEEDAGQLGEDTIPKKMASIMRRGYQSS
jgi:hypothetical protein